MPQTTPHATPQAPKEPFGRQGTGNRAGADDGTSQLLRAGLGIIAVGIVAALLAKTVLGGMGQHGPHTDSGWLALIAALMCLPFGLLLTALGSAKWLRNRRIGRAKLAGRNR